MMAPGRERGGDRDVSAASLPYLSHARVSRYLHCPEQYRLYYIERLRRRRPDAGLVFGTVIHQALAALFQTGQDPVEAFAAAWAEVEMTDLTYGERESWGKLDQIGRALLKRFCEEELAKLTDIEGSEQLFTVAVTTIGVPFTGVIDLVAKLEGKRTVTDFKTAAASYGPHEVVLSDQLTAYQLAEPEAEQSALCVFVKAKEPRIEWLTARRGPAEIVEYLAKVEHVAREIVAGHYYKRPGRWCGYCDFRGVCVGNLEETEETLTRVVTRS